jgi:antitoxin (DNA-binding transcriptional repressor) of toxin-antitoxin stability system
LEAATMKATMFEAKTQLSNLVKRAQRGEKIVLTTGRNRTPVAEIVALKPAKGRVLGLFYRPNFTIPEDFDELPEAELKAWMGETE